MFIKITIDHFEDEQVILFDQEKNKIILPQKFFPKNCQKGDIFNLEIKGQEEDEKEKNNLAKDILNEIFTV